MASVAAPDWAFTTLVQDPHTRVGADGRPLRHQFSCLRDHKLSRVKLAIVITAYNEDNGLIRDTLAGVCENLAALHGFHTRGRLRDEGGAATPDPASVADRIARAAHDSANGTAGEGPAAAASSAFASLHSLQPHEVVAVVVFDGREAMHASLFEEGGILSAEHKQMMEDAAALLPAPLQAAARVPADAAAASRRGSIVIGSGASVFTAVTRTSTTISGGSRGSIVGLGVDYAAGAGAKGGEADLRACHLFEGEYQPERARGRPFPVPLNLMLAVKEKNNGKLGSHVVALRGLLPGLSPRYVCLLDAGTVVAPTAILRLYRAMQEDSSIGGCCGAIEVDPAARSFSAPIVMAQHFEYSASNQLDKTLESCLGYVSVLPGAFSMYRVDAIAGAPLDAYFHLEQRGAAAHLSPAKGNMFLAEDRVLGFELVAKKGAAWRLYYDSGAAARTDVPDSLPKLVRQRRRWLNGSLAASLYTMSNWTRLLGSSGHSIFRKCGFLLHLLWSCVNMMLAVFALGNTYIFLDIVWHSFTLWLATGGNVVGAGIAKEVHAVVLALYLSLVGVLLAWGLGNMSSDAEQGKVWQFCSLFLALINLSALGLVGAQLSSASPWLSFLGVALAVYALAALLHGQLLQTLMAGCYYVLQLSTFVLLIPLYACANLHDVSWGTRPDSKPGVGGAQALMAAQAQGRRFREFRTHVLLSWVFLNVALVAILNRIGETEGVGGWTAREAWGVLQLALVGFSVGLRTVGCVVYVALHAWASLACLPRSVRLCCARPSREYRSSIVLSLLDGATLQQLRDELKEAASQQQHDAGPLEVTRLPDGEGHGGSGLGLSAPTSRRPSISLVTSRSSTSDDPRPPPPSRAAAAAAAALGAGAGPPLSRGDSTGTVYTEGEVTSFSGRVAPGGSGSSRASDSSTFAGSPVASPHTGVFAGADAERHVPPPQQQQLPVQPPLSPISERSFAGSEAFSAITAPRYPEWRPAVSLPNAVLASSTRPAPAPASAIAGRRSSAPTAASPGRVSTTSITLPFARAVAADALVAGNAQPQAVGDGAGAVSAATGVSSSSSGGTDGGLRTQAGLAFAAPRGAGVDPARRGSFSAATLAAPPPPPSAGPRAGVALRSVHSSPAFEPAAGERRDYDS